ncbi:MAG: DUF167 domain-containing protein [Actinomyces sp.]|nr:MAG: DUF167 domain-containing protein [Actinomyces sp.]
MTVRVHAGARRTRVRADGDLVRVEVTAPAEKGRANRAVVEAVADALGVRRSAVEIVAGVTRRDKRIAVRGLDPDRLAERLAALAEGRGEV